MSGSLSNRHANHPHLEPCWSSPASTLQPVNLSRLSIGVYVPVPVLGDLAAGLTHALTLRFLVPVIIPRGLFNILGSLRTSSRPKRQVITTRPLSA
jgi:hypothetical protein